MTAISQSNTTRRWEPRVVTADAHAPDTPGSDLPILASNLHPPALPAALVARERLCDRITQGVHERAVTLVSAPAGTGKTVSAACWYSHRPHRRPVAWLTATEHIDTPPRFWRHVLAAFRHAGVGVDRAERGAPSAEVGMPFFVRLAADLLDAPRPVVLVLDEVHTLSTPSVFDGVDFLIRHAYPKLRLVLCTRFEPRLPIQRYRLGDAITQLGMADLAFTPDESRQLMATSGVDVAADTAAVLTERVDGWATGIRLTALSLRDGIEPGRLDRAGVVGSEQLAHVEVDTDEAIASYLCHEVIDALPDADRRALLRLAVADHLWPELVETLTGARGGRRLLAGLQRRGCFVESSAHVPGGYRLHSAMRRVLRAVLEEETPDDASALHLTCARWLEKTQLAPGHAAVSVDAADGSQTVGLDSRVRPVALPLVERLTARETDVLRFLAQLYSTQEIAAAMFVSPNTVRTHVRGILRKLDVPRRNMAVRRARELQLI